MCGGCGFVYEGLPNLGLFLSTSLKLYVNVRSN